MAKKDFEALVKKLYAEDAQKGFTREFLTQNLAQLEDWREPMRVFFPAPLIDKTMAGLFAGPPRADHTIILAYRSHIRSEAERKPVINPRLPHGTRFSPDGDLTEYSLEEGVSAHDRARVCGILARNPHALVTVAAMQDYFSYF